MPAPHPKALRERVVAAYEDGEGSFAELGKRFKVGEASVNRWVSLKRRTGSVAPKPAGGARRPRKVDERGEDFLRGIIEDVQDATLVEMCAAYREEFGIQVSPQLMSEVVRRLGYTRKRGSSARWLLREKT